MHKIDGHGHVSNAFVVENVALGQAPTVVTAEWLNAVQDEIVNTLAEAGMTPAKANNSQLAQAILIIAGRGIPAGAVSGFGTSGAPAGWLVANGAAISRTAYGSLFSAIGTNFGAGDGSSTFNLPDLRNRMPVGAGGLFAIGATGGSKDAIVVSHSHGVSDPGHAHSLTSSTGSGIYPGLISVAATTNTNTSTSFSGISINSAGSSGVNANMPPYVSLLFCIKY